MSDPFGRLVAAKICTEPEVNHLGHEQTQSLSNIEGPNGSAARAQIDVRKSKIRGEHRTIEFINIE